MGEGSPKSLRGGGMDDVIFAGTATRPARDFAEVTILLEHESGDELQKAGESEVTRRIERGSGSAYRIDGRDVRAKDVALLFADAATGAHSPALVSQGKVGSIIAAKPTERRLLLEEAAGISGLHARRKDAEQKLRATETNLQRLGEMLSEQEARAAALRRQARAAERYRQLSDKIRSLEARLVHARWAEADRSAEAATAEAREAGEAVERLQSKWAVGRVAACCEELLGRIAAGLRDSGVRRFVIAGGETSGAVLQHLRIERLTVGPFAGPSLPLALDVTDDRPPVVLCLKSGKLAGLDAFTVALEAMTRGSLAREATTAPGGMQ